MYCSKCGTKINNIDNFCSNCGGSLKDTSSYSKLEKDKKEIIREIQEVTKNFEEKMSFQQEIPVLEKNMLNDEKILYITKGSVNGKGGGAIVITDIRFIYVVNEVLNVQNYIEKYDIKTLRLNDFNKKLLESEIYLNIEGSDLKIQTNKHLAKDLWGFLFEMTHEKNDVIDKLFNWFTKR
ncbi:PH domain-containing protein [Pontibacillus marinus]|uniref:YokE-like PH domain-containing protein n=1 Tax=Pontibacillus marinus BH030004 = DSM 16465 TaxID=1385511 RepID=A0A0A5GIL7_9BACI|nr:PH domain-containing protein [Pontibacillus marinus]KGX91048.1 hypothetical protein N783_13625 [Pontibacillus marinus BH030004 = DSM 16465]